MKHLILTLCAIIGFSFISAAQDYEDIVYLKNGSIIHGIIIEQVPNESLKIETRDGNVFFYRMDEVQKITKEMLYKERIRAPRYNEKFNKPKGYFGLVELGFATSLSESKGDIFRSGLTIINGYRVVPQFAVGVGVSLQGYLIARNMTIPVFLHLRSDFLSNKISPFVALNTGYNLSVSDNIYGGLMMEPQVGVSFNVGKKNRMTTCLGVAFDRGDCYYTDGYIEWYYSEFFKFLSLKFGLSF